MLREFPNKSMRKQSNEKGKEMYNKYILFVREMQAQEKRGEYTCKLHF